MKRRAALILIIFVIITIISADAPKFDVFRTGKPEQVSAFLLSGFPINTTDSNGSTPLMYAAGYNSNATMITILLEAGANATLKSKTGKTAYD